MLEDREEVGFACGEVGVCKLFVGGGSMLGLSGCRVEPTSTLIPSYLGEPLFETWDPFCSLQLCALQAISLALCPKLRA